MTTRRQQADKRLRMLVRQMQAVLYARRFVWRVYSPMTAAVLDTRLRLAGVWIVNEMRRIEGSVTAA